MELVQIYECLCDRTRLRVLHVLAPGPLCVCHFQEILREPQAKISKHLAYLRARGMVQCARQGNWMVYALPAKPSRGRRANLACLQDCAQADPAFQRDLARRKKLAPKFSASSPCGCVTDAGLGEAGPGSPNPATRKRAFR